MNQKRLLKLGILILLSLSVFHCKKDSTHRTYTEIEIPKPDPMLADSNSPHATMMDIKSEPNSGLSWITPEGWVEEKGSGMRLATFFFNQGNKNAECTIVMLDGHAGGVRANIERWMGQLNLVIPPSDEMENFINNSQKVPTKSGYEALIVDFTTLLSGSLIDSKSTVAAILQSETKTVFVKVTGNKSLLVKNKANLIELTKSLEFKGE